MTQTEPPKNNTPKNGTDRYSLDYLHWYLRTKRKAKNKWQD